MIAGQLAEVIIHGIIVVIDGGNPLLTLIEQSLQLIVPSFDSPIFLDELFQPNNRELQLVKRRLDLVFALEVSIYYDFDETEVVFDAEEVLVTK